MADPIFHEFRIPTNGGVQVLKVPDDQMRCCPCGSDLFDLRRKVTYAKPTNVIGALPICFQVEVFVCSKCQEVLDPQHGQTKAEVLAAAK